MVGTALADVCVAESAVLIGIPVGPHASHNALSSQLGKYAVRCREIAALGLGPWAGHMLEKILAAPVVHHVSQFYPLGQSAPRIALIAMQGLIRLPHHGFSKVVLRNLCTVGLPDMLAIDIVAAGLAFSAARRYAAFAAECNLRMTRAFALSVHLPLSSLGPCPPRGFSPIGWDGPSFSHTLSNNAAVLRDLGAWDLKGPKLCRALSPACSSQEFALELHRRLLLWCPTALCQLISAIDILSFLPTLSLAPARDKFGWLRFTQNAWATQGRFTHSYEHCLVCGAFSDRLLHIVCCRPFWRPVFAVLGVEGGRRTLRCLLLSEFSARLVSVGFRAHAALRGCPSASAAAWAEEVRAAA